MAGRHGLAVSETYDDAEPEETVYVSGVGNLSLRRAVRRYFDARKKGLAVNLFRGEGKTPAVYDAVDVERLAKLNKFRPLRH